MSPLDKIEKGIITGNWNLITEAYEILTSKCLKAPPSGSGEQSLEESLLAVVKEIFGPTAYIVNGVAMDKNETEEEKEEEEEEPEPRKDLGELEQELSRILSPVEIMEVPIRKNAKSKEDENEAWNGKQVLKLGMTMTEKVGHYGNKSVLISEADTDPEDIRVGLTQKLEKKGRAKIKKFTVKCSYEDDNGKKCKREFETRVDPSIKPEQICNRCVKNKARELRGD